MEDLVQVLFFLLIFIVGPLLEQVRRKGQQGPKQNRGPGRVERPVPTQVPDRSRTEEISRREAEPAREPTNAADMVPDDLWEILTGQKRPAPAPAPSADYDEAEPDEELDLVEARTQERWRPPEARTDERWRPSEVRPEETRRPYEVPEVEERSLETYDRHEVPVVVSMETLPPPPRVRHAEFHRRIAQLDEPEVRRVVPAAARLAGLARRGTLRDAMILQEVLGRPKGLE